MQRAFFMSDITKRQTKVGFFKAEKNSFVTYFFEKFTTKILSSVVENLTGATIWTSF